VILAAGEGTRLRPLTYMRPKVLIPVANRAFLGRQLDLLREVGIERVILVTGYKRDVLAAWLGESGDIGLEVETVVQRRARGTGDAIGTARKAVHGPFLVMNGDVLVDKESLSEMVRSSHTSVAAKHVPNPADFGVFVVRNGSVMAVAEKAEKPPSDLANVGVYIFEPDIFSEIERTQPNPKRNEIEITDTLQSMIEAGSDVKCYMVEEWHELGKPWDVLNLNELFLDRVDGPGPVGKGVVVGKNTSIDPRARIRGPAIIGSGCEIEGEAWIGPYSSIGSCCMLSGARIEGSVVMEGCTLEKGAFVGHSVLAPGCRVGKGAVLRDRVPGESIRMKLKGHWVDSGRERLGSILGDGCVVNDGTILPPGTMLDPGTEAPPGRD